MVEFTKEPDGSQLQLNEDGSKFRKDPTSGKTYRMKPDGKEEEVGFDEPTEGKSDSYTDRFGNVIQKYASGLKYKTTKSGDIYKTYPDGTTYKRSKDGRIFLVGNDITEPSEVDFFEIDPANTKYSTDEEGTKYKLYPNGVKYKTTEDGTIFKTYPDGSTYMRAKSGEAIRILTDNEKKPQELDFRDPAPNPKPKGDKRPYVANSNSTKVIKEGNIANNQNVINNKFANSVSTADYLPAVFFESNVSEVDPKYFPEVFMIADMLKKNPGLRLKIIGHCDSRSSEEYNKTLGMARSKNVAYILSNYFGIPEGRLEIDTRGEDDRLVKTDITQKSALAANRRVQFEVIKNTGNQSQPTENKGTLLESDKKETMQDYEK
jgi:outer membrane protein OmpA-like peptidoglycan-associated protein